MNEQRSERPRVEEEKSIEKFTFNWLVENFFSTSTTFESEVFTPFSTIPVKFRLLFVRGSKLEDYEYNAFPWECNLIKCSDEMMPRDLKMQCEVQLNNKSCMISETHNMRDRVELFTGYYKLPTQDGYVPVFRIGSIVERVDNRTLNLCFTFKFSNVLLITYQSNSCLTDFKSLYDSKELSDVTICAGGATLNAHKAILAARSPVFKAMFASEFVEKQTNCIKMKGNIAAGSVDQFLMYLYCGSMDNNVSFDVICNVYSLAHRYQVDDLVKHCSHMMTVNLSLNNVLQMLVFAAKYDDILLKEKATVYIQYHLFELTQQKAWKSFSEDHPDLYKKLLGLE